MFKKVLMAVDNYWTSPYHVGSHHYAEMFANNGWEVLFVSYPISPFHFIKKDKRQVLERYHIYKGNKKSGFSNIEIYVPMALITPNEKPIFNTKFVANYWHKLTMPNVVRYVKKLEFGEVDLLWFDSIIQYFWINEIKYKKSIFRITDKIDAFRKNNSNKIKLGERLKNRVDIIIYTARSLESYLDSYKNKAFFIPNGVDVKHFLKSSREVPDGLKNIPKPIAIYVGAIDEWFGVDFLRDIARKCRDISFVLIGKASICISKLQKEPNIFILGERSYNEIPKYMYNANVGIIPFNTNHPVVESINPLKLYEYMACGLPVVATRWKELEFIDSPAYLVDNLDSFVKEINNALRDGNSSKCIEFAKANSWEDKFKKIINL